MSVHHHLDLEIDTLKRKFRISALFFNHNFLKLAELYSCYKVLAPSWCLRSDYKLVIQGTQATSWDYKLVQQATGYKLVLHATSYKVVLQGGATSWCYKVVLQGLTASPKLSC